MQSRRGSLFLAAAGLAVVLTGSLNANTFTATPPVLTSGPSPFAPGCEGAPQSGTNVLNAEVEPWVDVNPTDSRNIIGVFQQDRWSNGGAHGLVAAVTHDGGVSWTRSWAHFSICSGGNAANGGDFERTSDPWVSFAPNGDAYQIAISFNDTNFRNVVLVSKSTNGGNTWSEPITLIRDTAAFSFNDKESITADPTNSRFVYAIWDRSRFPSDNADFEAFHSFAFRGDAFFSRTTNRGRSWEPARAIFAPQSNLFTIGHQIVVQPNGTLVDIFNLIQGSGQQPPQSNKFSLAVLRSTDKGVTWSDPIRIDSDLSVPVVDPDTGQRVRTGAGLPDIAVDSRGKLYAVWSDGRFSGGDHDDVALSRSLDGGSTWSAPIRVNQTPPGIAAFTPSVHVAADGMVGVTYYDFRNNTPAPGALTDYFLVHSHDAGATWGDEVRLTPASFDLETAPVARGFFLGDYEGLASIGNRFVPFFIQTNTGNTANRTDAFLTTAGP